MAARAIAAYGRIDVWVNNAAVTLFARFEEAPMDAYRRVIETNLFGHADLAAQGPRDRRRHAPSPRLPGSRSSP